MDKVGLGVVTNSPAMQFQGSVSQARRRDARYADIDRHRLHMQAVKGDTMTVRAQKLIAPRRPIAADDINFRIRLPKLGSQVVEQVEYSRIVMVDVAGAVITKIFVESCQSFREIAVTPPIDNVKAFAGVRVEQPKAIIRLARGRAHNARSGQGAASNHNQVDEQSMYFQMFFTPNQPRSKPLRNPHHWECGSVPGSTIC